MKIFCETCKGTGTVSEYGGVICKTNFACPDCEGGGFWESEKVLKWSCYDCMWSSDKCKNKKSGQYNKFLQDIERCSLAGQCDNTLGSSWRKPEDDSK